jgi:hypothetical protein
MPFSIQLDNPPDSQIQITATPEVISVVTTLTPVSLPLIRWHELTLPMCGSGADFKNTRQKMTWKAANTHSAFDCRLRRRVTL